MTKPWDPVSYLWPTHWARCSAGCAQSPPHALLHLWQSGTPGRALESDPPGWQL